MVNLQKRIVQPTPESEIWGATVVLFELAKFSSCIPDAIVVMEGMGEDWRLTQAIHDFDADNSKASYLVIGGQSDKEKTWKKRTVESLQRDFGLKRTDGVHINPSTPHTRSQAEWVAETLAALDPVTVGVYATAYHLIRAYLTILQSLNEREIRFPMFPVPVRVSPFRLIPELACDSSNRGPNAFDMVAGELARIKQYRKMEHVANAEDLQKYLLWLEVWCTTHKK